jgi:hypothetical protein
MFLVQDRIGEATYLVFTGKDPRRSGYAGQVIDDVALDYDMEAVHRWPNGHRLEACCSQVGGIAEHFEVLGIVRSTAHACFGRSGGRCV